MDFHIEDSGDGPAILFLHAGVADSRMWRHQTDLPGFRTIAFDKRGFGRTPLVSERYSDTTDAIAVLDRLGVGSAVVVGCSMGAATALDLAIDHADRVDGLVLVGGFPSGWEPEDGWEETPLEAEAVEAFRAGDLERALQIDYLMWLVGYGRDAADIDNAHRDLFFEMDRIALATQAERDEYQTGFEKRLNHHLDEVECPTLVVVGAHDEALLIKAAKYMADRLSEREAVVIDGAAHLPSMEQPQAFNRALQGFLDSI